MRFWGLKTCDTCRKAIKTLGAAGHDLLVIDVRADGVGADDLGRFHAEFGDELINRRSTTWRNLSEDERAQDPIDLLQKHPTLMKRPVIEQGENLTLGWAATVQSVYLKG